MRSYFGPAGDPPDDEEPPLRSNHPELDPEFLPYRIEVWDETGTVVEQVVAMARNRSIGFAAYFATKEAFPLRRVTIRDQFGELSRWDNKGH